MGRNSRYSYTSRRQRPRRSLAPLVARRVAERTRSALTPRIRFARRAPALRPARGDTPRAPRLFCNKKRVVWRVSRQLGCGAGPAREAKLRYPSRPRAATGSTSTILSPRTAIMRSTMLTTTHTWFGTTRTTSPTLGRALLRERSRKPCSSAKACDLGLRVFEDQAEAVVERAGVGGQRLGAADRGCRARARRGSPPWRRR